MGREWEKDDGLQYILRGRRKPDHRVEVSSGGHLVRRYGGSLGREDDETGLSRRRWQILHVLVGDADRAFTREQLAARIQEVYPDDGRLEPSAITNHISNIRGALGDSANDPGFIATDSKGRYRLCAAVDRRGFRWPPVPAAPPSSQQAAPGGEPPGLNTWLQRNWRLVILAAILLLIIPLLFRIVEQPFKVGFAPLSSGADALSRTVAASFPDRARRALGDLPSWSLYRFSNLTFFRPARLEGNVSRQDNRLRFSGRVSGLPSGCAPEILREAPEAFPDDLITSVVDEVLLQLDRESCVESLRQTWLSDPRETRRRRARHCLEAGAALRWDLRFCEAKELLIMAIELDSELLEAWSLLASVHENRGDDAAALEILKGHRDSLPSGTSEVDRLRLDRRIATLEGDYRRGHAALERIAGLTGEPRDLATLSWFVRTHRQDCERALGLMPADFENQAAVADSQALCGQPELALESYERHFQNQPGTVERLYPRAFGARLSGDYCLAPRDLATLLEREPDYFPARLEQITLLDRQGRRGEARRLADSLLLELTTPLEDELAAENCLPNHRGPVETHLCRPLLLEREARISASALYRAVDAENSLILLAPLEERRQRTPQHLWSLKALWAEGLAHLAAGDPPAAEEVARRIAGAFAAREAGGSRWEGHYLLHLEARLLLLGGRAEEAARLLQEVFGYALEERAYFRSELALALAASGQAAEAQEEMARALALEPASARTRCLAEILKPGTVPSGAQLESARWSCAATPSADAAC
ncbi:MAG: helix-turn-helix domain-containing protein [Acidobacteriota bacterium]